MSKKLNVKVNGNEYEVEVGDLSKNPVAVTVNGKEYEVEIGGNQAASTAKLVARPGSAPVVQTAPAPAAAAAAGDNSVTAPMPGKIVEISVKAGDEVTPGQSVCSLEAMKMRNIIRASREGTIASVEVSVGDKVAFGTVLVRYA
jgi:biotin carboxyl carrier protein